MFHNRKITPRDYFIKEIKKFKLRYNGVRNALRSASAEVLANSFIHEYLTRDALSIEFDNNHPKLENNKKDKENSDYYEIKIYKSLVFFGHYYRHNIDNEAYYLAGSACRSFVDHQSMRLNTHYEKSGIFICPIVDIYNVRHIINALTYEHYSKELRNHLSRKAIKSESLQFIIFPNWKDDHATVIIVIFDPQNKKTLAAILINSNTCQDYTNFTSSRFNYKNYYFYKIDSSSKETILEYIKIDLKTDPLTPGLCIKDEQNKTAYLLNEKYNHLDKLDELGKSGIDTKISINNGADSMSYLYIDEHIPIIDASHCLQTQAEDKNCSLYGLNFINAILNMLDDKEYSERIYQLALASSLQDTDSELALKRIFSDELKCFLPCYYNSNMTEKTYNEIKEHHMRQRWEIGSKALSINYPVTEEIANSSLIVEKPRLL